MSWGPIIGAGISAVGSIFGAKQSADAAQDAGRWAYEADMEALEWEKSMYREWQATYGGIEDNLADYFDKLNPELRAVQGLEAYEKEKDAQLKKLHENLAQRGLGTSGIMADVDTAFALDSAAERARIRAEAPMQVAQEKLGFLQIGLGQNPAARVGTTLANRANNAHDAARATAGAAGRATSAAWEAGANLAEEIAGIFEE